MVCNVYRPPSTPINCLESLAKYFVDSSLLNLDTILLGDLNCNLMGDNLESISLNDFISNFNLSQMVGKPTTVIETTKSLIEVIMTSNKFIVCLCDVLTCSISDHNLVYLALSLKTPRRKPSYVTIRGYKNYNGKKFCNDLALAPFHMVSFFDDLNDQVDIFNILFTDVLNQHAPIKRIKIKYRPNPFVSPEIRQLIKTRDTWHKSAIKSNDQLHWNAYRFFGNGVKCELRLAEKVHVRTEIHNSRRNSNSIWKIINRCLPNKSQNGFNTFNPEILASRFNEYFTSVGSTTAQKAHDLSFAHNLNFDFSIMGGKELTNNLCPAFQLREVSQQEVERVIKHFPSNKALNMIRSQRGF